ncbi:hypothetical protein [Blastococcus sp. SYSU DS1024]
MVCRGCDLERSDESNPIADEAELLDVAYLDVVRALGTDWRRETAVGEDDVHWFVSGEPVQVAIDMQGSGFVMARPSTSWGERRPGPLSSDGPRFTRDDALRHFHVVTGAARGHRLRPASLVSLVPHLLPGPRARIVRRVRRRRPAVRVGFRRSGRVTAAPAGAGAPGCRCWAGAAGGCPVAGLKSDRTVSIRVQGVTRRRRRRAPQIWWEIERSEEPVVPSVVDELWRSAQKLSWSERPQRQDVEAVAAAVHRSDAIVAVHRLVPGLVSSSALVITSRALLVGGARPGRHLQLVLSSAPSTYRYNSKVLVIPRDDISRVRLTAEAIVIHTVTGPVELLAPEGANRHTAMERALLGLDGRSGGRAWLGPRAHDDEAAIVHDAQYPGLWSGRYLVDGDILIARAPARDHSSAASEWLMSAGRAWRRVPRWAQWILAIALFFGLQTVAVPAGVVFAVLMVAFIAGTDPAASADRRAKAAATRRRPRAGSPEAVLAASRSIEARVAAAACRAWDETVLEPSWSSPALAGTREAFDGQGEVDTVVDLAIRIHNAREALGAKPEGPAADYWQQQLDALDRAALRLGERADALIRHRDQAAALSAELAQLAELERLERSALVIDDLTIATAAMPGSHGQLPVSEQISAARQTVGELVELMTRTRAPLAQPAQPPTF